VCHFLRPASFGLIELHVETLRKAKRADSLRVTAVQNDVAILEGLVWTVADLQGIDHHAAAIPQAPPPEEVEPWDAYLPGGEPPFPFWRNFDIRPVIPHPSEWGGDAREPRYLVWARPRVRPPVEDPFVDAGRMLMFADSTMYPAATLAHDGVFPYVAPSLDLAMSFHARESGSDWILVDARSSLSAHAVVAGQASTWAVDGRLLASAMQQMLQRP
jgi:acyl-CoA thioesterase-2